MSDLVGLEFEDQNVRTIMQGDSIWWVLVDVCKILQLGNASYVVKRLDEDERDGVVINDPIGRKQKTTIINESGLYSLILTSRQPAAKRFKKWVTSEVLPALRRDGFYDARRSDQSENWDWELLDHKMRFVRETRLVHGKQAAQTLWAKLDLPFAEVMTAPNSTSVQNGIDFVRSFLAACTCAAPRNQVQATPLKAAYDAWAFANKAPDLTAKTFGLCLTSLGVRKATRGHVFYCDIALIDPVEVVA